MAFVANQAQVRDSLKHQPSRWRNVERAAGPVGRLELMYLSSRYLA